MKILDNPMYIFNLWNGTCRYHAKTIEELANIARHSSSLCMIDFDDRNDDEEKLCDRITAEILMPESSFRTEAETIRNK